MLKRLFALLLAFVLAVGMLPAVNVQATDSEVAAPEDAAPAVAAEDLEATDMPAEAEHLEAADTLIEAVSADLSIPVGQAMVPDGLEYTVQDEQVTIKKYSGSATELTIPKEIEGYPVTKIGSCAFENCSSLKSITFPSTLTRSDSGAFENCKNLTDIYITDLGAWLNVFFPVETANPMYANTKDKNLYVNGELVTDVVIPEGVKSIPAFIFMRCKSLKSVTIPEGVTEIGEQAFRGCENLKTISIPSSLTYISYSVFENCVSLSKVYITDLAAWLNINYRNANAHPAHSTHAVNLFLNGEPVTDVVIPEGVTAIPDYAFHYCPTLTSVTIPDSVTSIGEFAFSFCKKLSQISGAKSVTNIGTEAFRACYNLTSFEVPAGVTQIGEYAFWDCTGLRSLSIPAGVTKLTEGMFDGCYDLWHIFYGGTQQKWDAMVEEYEGDGSIKGTWHCEADASAVEIQKISCTTQRYQCSLCEDVLEDTIPGSTHAYIKTVINPTNTKQGYTSYTCSDCGDSYKDDYKDALGIPKPSIKLSNDKVSGKPKISWTAIDEVKEYRVYRASSKKGTYKRVGTVTDDTSFVDSSASVGKKYYYKVRAIGIDGSKSSYSSIKTGYCDLAQPVVKAVNTASSGKIKMSWSKVSGAKKYYIYRSVTGKNDFKKIASTTKTSYTDSDAAIGTMYDYKIKAKASSSTYDSAYSRTMSVMRKCAQSDFEVKIASNGKPSLSWDKVSGVKRYEVYRAESEKGEYVLLKITTETSFKDADAKFDKDYWYRVDVIGKKAGTNCAKETPIQVHTTCAKPSVSIKLSSKKPLLTWKPVEGATKYYVYRATSKSGKYKKIATVEDATSYRDAKAKKGKTYYYKVKAIAANSAANSAYSSVDKIKSK